MKDATYGNCNDCDSFSSCTGGLEGFRVSLVAAKEMLTFQGGEH